MHTLLPLHYLITVFIQPSVLIYSLLITLFIQKKTLICTELKYSNLIEFIFFNIYDINMCNVMKCIVITYIL
jgi:hypothetical protein